MKGFLTEVALDDLAGIARYIGRDSIPIARRFTAALRRHALAVGKTPYLYPLAEGFERAGVRRRLYRGYLILYRVRDERAEILHVVNASQDWKSLLSDEES